MKSLRFKFMTYIFSFSIILCATILVGCGGTQIEYCNLGETRTRCNLEVTINSFHYTNKVDSHASYSIPAQGFVFCVVDMTVKNVAKAGEICSTSYLQDFKLVYNKDYEYCNSSFPRWFGQYDDYEFYITQYSALGSLNTLETRNVCAYFEIPAECQTNNLSLEIKLENTSSSQSSDNIIVWKLK